MDCHNRPAHQVRSPMSSVNMALEQGAMPRSLPYIKVEAVKALWDGVHRTYKIATHNSKLWTDLSAAMVADEERCDRLNELALTVREEAEIYGVLPGSRFRKAIDALAEEADVAP